MINYKHMIIFPHNTTILLQELDSLLQKKDKEIARLDQLRKNGSIDTQQLSEIDRKIQEIRRVMRCICS